MEKLKTTLLIDYGYCSGCHSCELACRNELGLGTGQWGMKLLEDGPRELADGTVEWNYLPYPTSLCDGCAERVAKGKPPACVQTCQGKVMYYGTPEEMAAKAKEIGTKVVIYQP
ncbi:MAG: 4Fe-4S dicluster domain-containing protein [Coriobacteriales bacterium]|jgi:Fe-S-cluster-containing dehydrogenase component